MHEHPVGELYKNRMLSVASQRIVSLPHGGESAWELLIRCSDLRDPVALFARAAEQGVLYSFDMTCARLAVTAAASLPQGGVHVNLLPSTLIERDPADIAGLFDGVEHQFYVELSEQPFIVDAESLRPAVDAIRAKGVRIALDDVGFGRSSLEAMLFLDPEVIKIDRRRVIGVSRSTAKRAVLQRLLKIIESVNGLAIAEGVESAEDCSELVNMGVKFAQGYLWGRPQELWRQK